MPQITYNAAPPAAVAGMLADSTIIKHTGSFVVEGTLVRPGLMVSRGTNKDLQAVQLASGLGTTALGRESYLGVAAYDNTREPYSAANEYAAGDPIPVHERGDVFVQVEGAVTAGTQVFVRTTTVGADIRGQFAGGASANHAPLTGVIFVTSTTGAGIAAIRLP
jgi:hypothetical protein